MINIPAELRYDIETMSELWAHVVDKNHTVVLSRESLGPYPVLMIGCQDCDLSTVKVYEKSFRAFMAKETGVKDNPTV